MRRVSSSWTEQVAERRLRACDHSRVPLEASVSCVATRTSLAGAQQRTGHDDIDVGLAADLLGIRRIAGEPRRRHAGAHDQRLQAAERAGERIRQAEGQEVGLGIRPQHPKRQNDETGQRGAAPPAPIPSPASGIDSRGAGGSR